MNKETNIRYGLKWGVIIGVVYCILLVIRYTLGEKNALLFGVWSIVSYLIVLVLLFICGVKRRQDKGGYIEFREAFQVMFMAVIGFEFFFMAFNFIYLKFINPEFFLHLKNSMEIIMERGNIDQSAINDKLKSFDDLNVTKMNLGTFLLSFANTIVASGIFALIFGLIIKRKSPFSSSPETL